MCAKSINNEKPKHRQAKTSYHSGSGFTSGMKSKCARASNLSIRTSLSPCQGRLKNQSIIIIPLKLRLRVIAERQKIYAIPTSFVDFPLAAQYWHRREFYIAVREFAEIERDPFSENKRDKINVMHKHKRDAWAVRIQ